MSAAKLEIAGLRKSFGSGAKRSIVLDDVSLVLGDREFVSLVGTSGCGKSTLLSIVAGLQSFDSGQALLDGRSIDGPGLDRGVVFQSYTLLPWLTAQGNIEFALRAAGYSAPDRRRIAQEHLALVKLPHGGGLYPHQMSGGMLQRVAIARALSYRPKMLLMDEPFGALDALTRHQMQELLTQIWEEHRLTVLFVTHDVEEAVYLSDRVAVMGIGPGHVAATFEIPLRRPRHVDVMDSSTFVDIQRRILRAIRSNAVPTDHRAANVPPST